MPTSPFTQPKLVVSTEVFNGPLDLLLTLLERRKLFINDISLKQVTDDYLDYIQEREVFPVEEGAHFIFIASTLMLMKSRSLLPEIELTEEEEEDIENLERRLAIYKKIQILGQDLAERYKYSPGFKRRRLKEQPAAFAPDQKTNLPGILEAMQAVLDQSQTVESEIPQARVKTAVKLEEVIKSLTRRVEKGLQLRFSEFTGQHRKRKTLDKTERVEIAVSFIALLELVRQGLMRAKQLDDDINIEVATVDTPRYE